MLDVEKKLSLDDKVTKWIPEFKLDNKAVGEQAIIRAVKSVTVKVADFY